MKSSTKKQEITGVVKNFNISPKGFYEGVLIEAKGEIVQVNFDPEAGAYLSMHFTEGKKISLQAEPRGKSDKGPSDHPVFDLISFKDADKKLVSFDDSDEQRAKVSGKIERLNYALHGEVNGAVLDTGDFVHMKPKGAKVADIAVGQKLTAEGEVRFSLLPNRVIEADTVNGIALHEKPKLKRA